MLQEAKEPDNLPLHEPWYSRLSKFQRLLVIAAIRPDKLVELVQTFICDHLGYKFLEPVPLDLGRIQSTNEELAPIVFFSNGEDNPANWVRDFALTRKAEVKSARVRRDQVCCSVSLYSKWKVLRDPFQVVELNQRNGWKMLENASGRDATKAMTALGGKSQLWIIANRGFDVCLKTKPRILGFCYNFNFLSSPLPPCERRSR